MLISQSPLLLLVGESDGFSAPRSFWTLLSPLRLESSSVSTLLYVRLSCFLVRLIITLTAAFLLSRVTEEAAAYGLEVANDKQFFERQRAEYDERRHVLMAIFDDLGLEYTRPDGSYFLLVDFSRFEIPAGYEFPASLDGRGHDFKCVLCLPFSSCLRAC